MKRKTKILVHGFWLSYLLILIGYQVYAYFSYYSSIHPWQDGIAATFTSDDILDLLVLYPLGYLIFIFVVTYIPKFISWVDSKL